MCFGNGSDIMAIVVKDIKGEINFSSLMGIAGIAILAVVFYLNTTAKYGFQPKRLGIAQDLWIWMIVAFLLIGIGFISHMEAKE